MTTVNIGLDKAEQKKKLKEEEEEEKVNGVLSAKMRIVSALSRIYGPNHMIGNLFRVVGALCLFCEIIRPPKSRGDTTQTTVPIYRRGQQTEQARLIEKVQLIDPI